VLVLLLIAVKDNRQLQAWLILLPVLAVAAGWSMFARLLSMPPDGAEPVGGFLVTLAASWAAVWLLGSWLAGRKGVTAFFSAWAAMLAVGVLFCLSVYGLESGREFAFGMVSQAVAASTLLLATTLSSYYCRPGYRPGRFMAWLLLWTVIVTTLAVPFAAVLSVVFATGDLWEVLGILVMAVLGALIGGGVVGVAIYLVNLPFMVLATRNAFFRARFQSVLRLTPAVAAGPSGTHGVPTLDAVLGTMSGSRE
jgi:hypothetical protein